MGFLRIYLALCVVVAHANPFVPWLMHSGIEAVQIFFMISGFYMALIADKYPSRLEFYCSRFLRIFIPYWFIAIGIFIACIASGMVMDEWGVLDLYKNYSADKNGLAGVIVVAISNITIFFQDTVMFLTHDGGESLSFTRSFGASKHPLWLFLIIPQAWSIAVEVMFYIMVPFIAKWRTRNLIIILLISLGFRIFAYTGLGLTNDPWTYRFFPFELLLFVSGMLACRVYRARIVFFQSITDRMSPHGFFGGIVYAVALSLLFFFMKYFALLLSKCVDENYAVLFLYVIWACLLPFLFSLSKSLHWDRFIGELSYPVYLVHVFVISVVGIIIDKIGLSDIWWGKFSAILSIFIAWIVYISVIKPLDKRRHVLAKRMASRLRCSNDFYKLGSNVI